MGNAVIISSKAAYRQNNLGKVTFIMIDSAYLCINALENITVSFTNDLEYNDGVSVYWKSFPANTEMEVNEGDTLILRGNLTPTQTDGIGTFSISGECTIAGHVIGLLEYDELVSYSFKKLFENCIGITDASALILPDEVAQSCYEAMFKGCTSLETSPALYATILATDCYKEMFYGCSSLNSITIYSETQLGTSYSYNWVYGVSETGSITTSPSITYTESGVHGVPNGWTYTLAYDQMYFTIESLADSNSISIAKSKSPSNIALSYSTNDGETWTDLTISAATTFTTINTGDKIIFKGINDYLSTAWDTYYRFNGSKNFKVYGNAMSLLWGDDFINNSEFKTGTTHNLCALFYGTSTLKDAENLILPATTCTDNCYNGMFRTCTNLTKGPKLPATTLALGCYSSMFESCVRLEEIPELPATTLAEQCYQRMFCMNRSSTSAAAMTKSPKLPALTLENSCYKEMFKGNSNLIEVTCLATASATSATADWLLNVSSNGTFYKNSLMSSWASSSSGIISGIPSGWTIENYVEE